MTDQARRAQPVGIDDLLPGLEHPLWQGQDAEFAAWVQDVFDVPDGMTQIAITGRGPSGRSAVAIGAGHIGGIIFAVAPNPRTQKTKITPMVLGPLCLREDVVVRAHAASADVTANSRALSALAARHLPAAVVLDLFVPGHVQS